MVAFGHCYTGERQRALRGSVGAVKTGRAGERAGARRVRDVGAISAGRWRR